MTEYTLKIKHHFDAAHKLENYKGKCQYLHGHRWNVDVYIQGTQLVNDMLIDFTKIKNIIDELDHSYLNDQVKFNPTAERIAEYLKKRFQRSYPKIKFMIIIYESPECSVMVKSNGFKSK